MSDVTFFPIPPSPENSAFAQARLDTQMEILGRAFGRLAEHGLRASVALEKAESLITAIVSDLDRIVRLPRRASKGWRRHVRRVKASERRR
jgi:hypothetical protein